MLLKLLAPDSAASGAALYNRQMVAALRRLGHDAAIVNLVGRYPSDAPDPADLAVLHGVPPGATLLLDGLALGLHAALSGIAAGLIHHPSPLHAERDDVSQAALRDAELAAMAALPRLIATSHFCADRLIAEYGVPPQKLTVVVGGVDDAPRRMPRTGGPCHVLSLGPLVPRRRHDVLLNALIALADLDWRLTLVGRQDRDPGCAAALHALAEASGFGARVTFVDGAAGVPWEQTDILAVAHPVSGLSGALAAVLRRGIPLALCTSETTLCPAGAGVVCPPDDAVTLSKSLRRMIFDDTLRAELAAAAYQAGQLLPGWEQQAKALVQALA